MSWCIVCEYPINKLTNYDYIQNENIVCALMNKSNTKSINIGNEKWKCNIILEMLDCLYGF